MAQHGPKLYDFRLVDSYDEIDPGKEASELRRIIWEEIAEDYSDLDMEAEYRNPVFYSPQEIASKNVPLRYVRRLLGRSDLEFLPLSVLRSLLESAGFLDQPIAPEDAQQMLRFCNPARPGFMAEALREAADQLSDQQFGDNLEDDSACSDDTVAAGFEDETLNESDAGPSRLSKAELRRFYTPYLKKNPNHTHADLAKALEVAYPDHSTTRQMRRDIAGPRKPGPKTPHRS